MPETDKTGYHHGDLRRAVLDACFELLEEGGTRAVVMAKAARKAGVSSGAPYRHFKDRAALLKSMAQVANSDLQEALGEAAGSHPDPASAFRAVGVAYVKWAADNPAKYRLITDPAFVQISDEQPQEAQYWRQLGALLDAGEPLPPRHPLLVQLAGRALAHGIASLFSTGLLPALGIDARHAEAVALAVTGITAIGDPAQ